MIKTINIKITKETWHNIIFGIIKKMFIVLLASIAIASNHTKCVSLSNQKCEIQHALINLHLNNAVKNCTSIHLQLN